MIPGDPVKQHAAAGGPDKRTEALYRNLHDRLAAYIRRRVPTDHDAEEILQEVFLRIHSNIESLNEAQRATAWVLKIASNAIADFHRARARSGSRHETLRQTEDTVGRPDDARVQGAEPAAEVAQCMSPLLTQIPHQYAAVLELTDLAGMTQKDAAEQLGLSVSALKSRARRGRGMVKDLLLGCCDVELDRRGQLIGYERRQGGRPCGCGPTCEDEDPPPSSSCS
jgi:RNA polymerase sigma-70 factor (ECF subfamily)